MSIARLRRFFLLGSFFVISSVTVGCLNTTTPPEVSCPQPSIKEPSESTAHVDVSIYLDATPSMQGFVVPRSTTRYINLLDAIVASFQGWEKSIKYYRFGEAIEQFDEEQYSKAKKPEFYNSSLRFVNSDISLPIKQNTSDGKSLKIIVTDLYQKEGEIDTVIKSIDKKYFKNKDEKSIGIMALKSEFSGSIFDIGLAKKQMNYDTSTKESDKYHPLYLIVIGSDGDIKKFFDTIKTKPQGKNAYLDREAKFVLFSKTPIYNVELLKVSNEKNLDGRSFENVDGILSNNGTLRKNDNHKKWIDFLRVNSLTNKESKRKYSFRYQFPSYSPNIQKIEQKIISKKHNDFKNSFTPKIEVSNSSENLNVDFSINSIPNPGIYGADVELYAKLAEEKWWEEWNGDEKIVDQSDGSKTYNLLPFLNGLKSISTPNQQVKLAVLCYVLEVGK
jgi:hypothetical protein